MATKAVNLGTVGGEDEERNMLYVDDDTGAVAGSYSFDCACGGIVSIGIYRLSTTNMAYKFACTHTKVSAIASDDNPTEYIHKDPDAFALMRVLNYLLGRSCGSTTFKGLR